MTGVASNDRRSIVDAIATAIGDTLSQDRDALVVTAGPDRLTGRSQRFADLRNEHATRFVDTSAAADMTVAVAVGAALAGRRVIADLGEPDVAIAVLDELVTDVQFTRRSVAPGPLRLTMLVTVGADHASARLDDLLLGATGVGVVVPSNPTDAAGLMAGALLADDPVVVVHDARLDSLTAPTDDDTGLILPGSASVLRPGDDVTVIASGAMVGACLGACALVGADGIDVELIDLRSLSPLDEASIVESVMRTNHCVVVDAGAGLGGAAAEIAAVVQAAAFDHLDAPIARVVMASTSRPGPDSHQIADEIRRTTVRQVWSL